jgi:hypothetical protein
VTLLILDHAGLSYASSPKPTLDTVLKKACAQFMAYHVLDEIVNQFTAPPRGYSISQLKDFIVRHRL